MLNNSFRSGTFDRCSLIFLVLFEGLVFQSMKLVPDGELSRMAELVHAGEISSFALFLCGLERVTNSRVDRSVRNKGYA